VRPRLPLRRERRFMARVRTDWGCDSEFGHVWVYMVWAMRKLQLEPGFRWTRFFKNKQNAIFKF
jgi:hypothetical protein